MLRPYLTTAAVALLGASAMAQGDAKLRLSPITSTPRHAGVFHVATGTWTRHGNMANVTGPDIIYNNTCAPFYFSGMVGADKWQHRSRVPTTAANGAPTTGSPTVPGGNDEAPGCATSYVINGFEVLICTSRPVGSGSFTMNFEFADAYLVCGGGDMVPTQSFPVVIPPDTGTTGQTCWIVDVDLDGSSQSFALAADQDGTYIGPSTAEQFGFSWGMDPAITAVDATGPVIAGNFTWAGGPFTGALPLCSGTDGTIWDSPINLAEEGTGMASLDAFRTVTGAGFPSGPGCYFFGGTTIHADFYLKLFSNAGCGPVSPMVQVCFPGFNGVIGCPCGQPNNPAGGCANFGPGATSGAVLNASGVASLTADTVLLIATNERPAASLTNVFWAGKVPIGNGQPAGAGVRCATLNLKRLYNGQSSGGTIARPTGTDPTVHSRSAAVGSPIIAGETRVYFNLYRDNQAAGPCGNTASTINATNAGTIVWFP
jgi:hypothetical protein